MSDKFDKFWDELVSKHHQREGLTPTPEQLEKEIAKVDAIPLPEDEIESIVSKVSCGDVSPTDVTPDLSWIDEIDTSSIEEGVLQLNRNKGESDADIEERLEELRKKALKEGSNGEDDVERD